MASLRAATRHVLTVLFLRMWNACAQFLDTWQDGAEVETKDEVSSLLQRLSDHDACDI